MSKHLIERTTTSDELMQYVKDAVEDLQAEPGEIIAALVNLIPFYSRLTADPEQALDEVADALSGVE